MAPRPEIEDATFAGLLAGRKEGWYVARGPAQGEWLVAEVSFPSPSPDGTPGSVGIDFVPRVPPELAHETSPRLRWTGPFMFMRETLAEKERRQGTVTS